MQVLAGAGPAVAAVPLVVVWAGGSAFNLVQGIARRQVGVRGTASRVGFVGGQTVAQVGELWLRSVCQKQPRLCSSVKTEPPIR